MRTTLPTSSLNEWHVPLLPRQSVSRDEITQKRLLGPFFYQENPPKKSFQPARREKKVGKKLPFSYFLVRIFSHFSCSFLAMIYGPRDFSPWKIKRRVFAEKSKLGLERRKKTFLGKKLLQLSTHWYYRRNRNLPKTVTVRTKDKPAGKQHCKVVVLVLVAGWV